MKRAAFFIIFITLAFSSPAYALGKPDFSGTWTLDMARSDVGHARSGAMAGTRKVTIVINQTPAALTITRKIGERSETAVEKLDGSESINKSPSGQDIRSTSRWEDSNLVTKSAMPTKGGAVVESTSVRSLSADGKVMTIETTMKTPNGINKRKLIYNKQ